MLTGDDTSINSWWQFYCASLSRDLSIVLTPLGTQMNARIYGCILQVLLPLITADKGIPARAEWECQLVNEQVLSRCELQKSFISMAAVGQRELWASKKEKLPKERENILRWVHSGRMRVICGVCNVTVRYFMGFFCLYCRVGCGTASAAAEIVVLMSCSGRTTKGGFGVTAGVGTSTLA